MKKYPKDNVVARVLLLFTRSNLLITGGCFVGESAFLAMTW